MNNRLTSILASLTVGVVAVGILAVAMPASFWGGDGFIAALALFLALTSPAFWPRAIRVSGASDAPAMAMIGPVALIWTMLTAIAMGEVVFVTLGWLIAARVFCLLWLGTYVVGFLSIQTSTNVVSAAAAQTQSAAVDARNTWISKLRVLEATVESAGSRASIGNLIEKVRFAANDKRGAATDFNANIEKLLESMLRVQTPPEELTKLIATVEVALLQREQHLAAARAQA
jgi:hypothetical protein